MAEYDLETIRHSTAHVMAHAVTNLFPGVKIAIGPVDRGGVLLRLRRAGAVHAGGPRQDRRRDDQDHQSRAADFVRKEISRDEALELFADEPYKVELIQDLPEGEVISIYEEGDFVDLCRGPHVAQRRQDQGVQAAEDVRRVLARRRAQRRCSSASTARRSLPSRSLMTT